MKSFYITKSMQYLPAPCTALKGLFHTCLDIITMQSYRLQPMICTNKIEYKREVAMTGWKKKKRSCTQSQPPLLVKKGFWKFHWPVF